MLARYGDTSAKMSGSKVYAGGDASVVEKLLAFESPATGGEDGAVVIVVSLLASTLGSRLLKLL